MSVTVVIGSQFGDEGKGKLVDVLLEKEKFGLVARCAGGHNAGHSLVVDGKSYHFHILPSGLIAPGAKNLIGNGTVVHIPQFFKELNEMKEKGINTDGRIFVSDRAHVLFQLHKQVDGLREKALGDLKVGTTGNGIGPCYSDKSARSGIRINEIFHKSTFDFRLRALASKYKDEFGDKLSYDVEAEIKDFDGYRKSIAPYVVDSVQKICEFQDSGASMMVEAANALMLDVDAGTFPYVTSSNTGLAGVFSGLLGIRPESITTRIGVAKAYQSRVGAGPFPTEDFGEAGDKLQSIGKEFGTTTGRRRRCGWLDLVILRYSASINRYTQINLTKLDVLDSFETIKVGVAYHCKNEDGTRTTYTNRMPANLKLIENENVEIEYTELKGWQKDITGCTKWDQLPQAARDYVDFVEREIGVPIRWIGVGPSRDAMIEK